MGKFRDRDRIRVITDFPDDHIWKGDTGIVVGRIRKGTYAVFLDKDEQWAEENNVKSWPVYMPEEDMELESEDLPTM